MATCAVAALRSVLASQFDVHIREDLLRFAGDDASDPIVRSGTATPQLRRILAAASKAANTGTPWKLRVRRFGGVAALADAVRAGRFPLVRVTNEAGLHMVVVCGYKPGRLRYFDPGENKVRWIGVGAFRQRWQLNGETWMATVR